MSRLPSAVGGAVRILLINVFNGIVASWGGSGRSSSANHVCPRVPVTASSKSNKLCIRLDILTSHLSVVARSIQRLSEGSASLSNH